MSSESSNRAPDSHSKNALRAWLQLTKCAKRIERRVNSCLVRDHKSSLSRFDVLANLERASGDTTSTTQLAKLLLASKGNITRLLDRMEDDQLIERKPNKVDRRVSDIHLAGSGSELFARMATDHEKWADDIFNVLTNDEIKTLIGLIGKLRSRLDEIENNP